SSLRREVSGGKGSWSQRPAGADRHCPPPRGSPHRALGSTPAPGASLDVLFPAACLTLSARSLLSTSEARDAGCLRFGGTRGAVLAVFPGRHPLGVLAPAVFLAHPNSFADAELPSPCCRQKAIGDHPPRACVVQVLWCGCLDRV